MSAGLSVEQRAHRLTCPHGSAACRACHEIEHDADGRRVRTPGPAVSS